VEGLAEAGHIPTMGSLDRDIHARAGRTLHKLWSKASCYAKICMFDPKMDLGIQNICRRGHTK